MFSLSKLPKSAAKIIIFFEKYYINNSFSGFLTLFSPIIILFTYDFCKVISIYLYARNYRCLYQRVTLTISSRANLCVAGVINEKLTKKGEFKIQNSKFKIIGLTLRELTLEIEHFGEIGRLGSLESLAMTQQNAFLRLPKFLKFPKFPNHFPLASAQ